MNVWTRRLFVASIMAGVLVGAEPARGESKSTGASNTPIDFQRDIRPILAEHCLSCHGNDKPEGGVRLSKRETALGAGESGQKIIVPGKPDESKLIHRVLADDPAERMPPEGKPALGADQVNLLKRWIAEGAVWGDHWAFQPIRPVSVPSGTGGERNNAIDGFVQSELARVGMGWTPSRGADRYTLIRRLSYDLRGLPPTIEEVDEFVHDALPDAYERLVDRLLASPHFGERWGRHWLDLAHYADSDGYEKDRARPDAYRYRDWVVDSFNRDQPFDQFTVEQLAGDLLPEAQADQRIATAFLRQTLTNEEGGVDQEEFRIAACFDRAETVGTVWLGLTIGCARCHTHKYDPIPHADYYRLFAFFNNAEETLSTLATEADDLSQLERDVAPLEAALETRYREFAPAEAEWEQREREAVMAVVDSPLAESPAEVVRCESTGGPAAKSDSRFQIADGQVQATANDRAVEDYVVRLKTPREITGLKLYALSRPDLPKMGPGLAENGNFVVTGLRLSLDLADGSSREVPLHRPAVDFSQKGFSAESVLKNAPDGQSGWAVGGKTGANHWLQVRTAGALQIPEGATLRLVIEQRHGRNHLLGAFRVAWLQGDARGLHLPSKPIADALEMYPEKRVAATKRLLFEHYVDGVLRDPRVRELQKQIADHRERLHARVAEVRTMTSPRIPRPTRVFDRGEFLSPKQEVTAQGLEALPSLAPRATGAGADRLDLARWLVASENPLTARVAVNHVWQHLFGQGLVRTANDFGVRGERPSHPELLDWLADFFRGEARWSRKTLIRTIVLSSTYRQASVHRPDCEAVDPLNTKLFRQNRFRVEAEVVRDITLAASGLLSPKIGGPSVFPAMPADLAALSYANSFSWKPSPGEDHYRRGMYTFFKRTIAHPSLTTFDAPDANVACVVRTVSNTPLQSLTLLNNETHLESAIAFAERISREEIVDGPGDADRLARAFRICVARSPQTGELATLERVLARSREWYGMHAEEARALLGNAAGRTDTPAELAAWAVTLRVLLNLDEFVTRE